MDNKFAYTDEHLAGITFHRRIDKADWDESQHPRDERGRFSDGGGNAYTALNAPKNQIEAVRAWQHQDGYKEINRHLHNDKPLDDGTTSTRIVALQAAIGAAPKLSEDIVTYRGLNGYWAGQMMNLQQGDAYTDMGFVASSKDVATANTFTGNASIDDRQLLVEITIPAGTQALDVSRFSSPHYNEEQLKATEQEMLLPPATTFEVTGRTDYYGTPMLQVRVSK